jgi:hypothetical protein
VRADHDAAIVVVAEAIELLRITHGQLLQHHGVDEGEDGGVGADAEGEREDNDETEGGRFAKRAKGKADVASEVFDERFPSGGANFFFGYIDRA